MQPMMMMMMCLLEGKYTFLKYTLIIENNKIPIYTDVDKSEVIGDDDDHYWKSLSRSTCSMDIT